MPSTMSVKLSNQPLPQIWFKLSMLSKIGHTAALLIKYSFYCCSGVNHCSRLHKFWNQIRKWVKLAKQRETLLTSSNNLLMLPIFCVIRLCGGVCLLLSESEILHYTAWRKQLFQLLSYMVQQKNYQIKTFIRV